MQPCGVARGAVVLLARGVRWPLPGLGAVAAQPTTLRPGRRPPLSCTIPLHPCEGRWPARPQSVALSRPRAHLHTDNSALFVVVDSPEGIRLEARQPIAEGTEIIAESSVTVAAASMHTIQFSESEHMDCASAIRFTSHSCDPNCRMYLRRRPDRTPEVALKAIRDIDTNDVLSFDYVTTEWHMQSPFTCLCGAAKCRGVVRGFRHLSHSQRREVVREHLSEYILWRITEVEQA